MALVTLERGPCPDPTTEADVLRSRRDQLQRRQSFAVLRGAALGLHDVGTLGAEEEDETPEGTQEPGHWDEEQKHRLCRMMELLRPQDNIRLAVQLESARPPRLRYLLVVSPSKPEARDETVLLGVDFPKGSSSGCSLGLALPLWSDSQVYLHGDGGFSVSSGGHSRIFKPISIQTMWASELELTERRIREELRHVLDACDLDSVTAKEIRQALEQRLGRPLQDHRDFIDNEALLLLAQRDRASRIFPHVYLGSEWNAANLEELQRNGVSHILNVSREIDNFFPELFTYHNVRLWDEESTQLLPHWPETHRFIETARAQGSRVLVHCKMGVSRSAATVVAYAMKQYGWEPDAALRHVKDLRPVVHPIPSFLRQLHTYQGILTASRQSQVWEQKAAEASPERPGARVPAWLPPPTPTDPSVATKEEPGPRRISLRKMMRSISCLEAPDQAAPLTPGDLPEVFPREEGIPVSPQEQTGKARPPGLESQQRSPASMGPRRRASAGPRPVPSAPRARRMVRQAGVDDDSGGDC
ncbi:protein phosphatase Slingshot homolog 3 isoform X2 [Tachyglossus aculeatus]|uniref:protein phosphatase Slingshot homolog 3 isoform X2 n=1 Tax=Tachyglossus aculeatus TaxID=9261 RepID=UPI0018F3F6B8|nr:protein phosphatase Slingshot homolog 3 isoform X2 [Tachyglossus aculeatus]